MYKTTVIRIPKNTLQALKIEAARENKSLAELIRIAVEKVYGKKLEVSPGKDSFKKDPFFSLLGLCRTGLKDGSIHHDRDVYGIGES